MTDGSNTTRRTLIAGGAVFLASPAAAMITGTSIDVSAGAAARYTA